MYEPSSCDTFLKMIFAIFHLKGISFCWKDDFNGVGEFGSVMTQLWRDQSSIEPKFGTGSKKSTFDIDVDNKLQNKISLCHNGTPADGKTVFPFSCDKDLQMVLCHSLGRFMGLRGAAPLRKLVRQNFKFLKYETGRDIGKDYVKYAPVIVAGTAAKGRQLSLKNTTLNIELLEKLVM